MICVSWFCAKAALAMDVRSIEASETSLRVIEDLHRDALILARAGSERPDVQAKWKAPVGID